MKKIIGLMMALAIVLSIASCTQNVSKTTSTNSTEDDAVTIFKGEGVLWDTKPDGAKGEKYNIKEVVFKFSNNGKVEGSSKTYKDSTNEYLGGGTSKGTYKIEGTKLTCSYEGEPHPDDPAICDYTYDGTTLILKYRKGKYDASDYPPVFTLRRTSGDGSMFQVKP